MNKLEKFAQDFHPIFSQSKEEIEEMFGLKLEIMKNKEGVPTLFSSTGAKYYLSEHSLKQRPKELKDTMISIDVREAEEILNIKRDYLQADAVVSVTYVGPYCRAENDKTILARGYPVKVVEKKSYLTHK